eukprot:TRINITY_DN4345_c0_g1_i1.p1 TRINITY_DN4345_c0_g1~~TRINITY_DN4345_c0_g1_i1.p1  ORF type:complete len:1221 (+),score=406.54 TRINITY_DN4345_c0_g1_i1:60-3722(+)
MCRMCMVMTCNAEGILLADIVTKPAMSIIRQSFCSQERAKLPPGQLPILSYEQSYLNGDGYGVGWYCKADPIPCVFTSIKPAWNDRNLEHLAAKIRSDVVLAHVRAAGPGTPVGEVTCHPFRAGKFLWMHNGLIGGFAKTRRRLIEILDDRSFELAMEHSGIDSVVAFGIFLTILAKKDVAQDGDPWCKNYPPTAILESFEETVTTIIRAGQECKVTATSLLNFIVTDGSVVLATRVVDNPPCPETPEDPADMRSVTSGSSDNGEPAEEVSNAASLYLSTGYAWTQGKTPGEYHMKQTDMRNHTIIMSSEPLSTARDEWMPVPANHIVMCSRSANHIDVTFMQYPEKPKHVASVLDLIQVHSHDDAMLDEVDEEVLHAHGVPLAAQLSMAFSSGSPATCLKSCYGGEFLVGGMQDGSLVIWDLLVSRATEPRRHPGPVLALLVDEDPARNILFSSSHNELRIWNIHDIVTRVHDASITCLCVLKFTPTRGQLLSLCGDASRLYLGFQAPQLLALNLVEYREELERARSRSKSIRFFTIDLSKVGDDKGEGKFRAEWMARHVGTRDEQHNGFVYDMILVNGELVTAGGDGRLIVWNDTTYAASLTGHTSGVTSLAQLGASHVISGSFDSTIREWDLPSRRCLRTMHNPSQTPVLSVKSLKNNSILTAYVSQKTGRYELAFWDMKSTAIERKIEGCGYYTKDASHIKFNVLEDGPKLSVAVSGVLTGEVGVYDIHLPDAQELPLPKLLIRDEVVGMLKEFVKFPSIPSDHQACLHAARWVASHYESVGATVMTYTQDKCNPVILGMLTVSPTLPTIVLYSHYDVVPPGDNWQLNDTEISPWELTGHDGYVYGRGVTDNKGPMVAQFRAVKALLDNAELGMNVLFVCEGDEENMGGGCLTEALAKARQRGWLANCYGAVVTNSTWVDDEHPSLCYGSRGVVDLEVKVSGPKKQLHTGSHGNLVSEPLHDILGILGNLIDPTGRVCIPSFYSRVPPPTPHDLSALNAAAEVLNLDDLKESLGIPGFRGEYNMVHGKERGVMLLRHNWLQPSMCITEISTGRDLGTTNVARRVIAVEGMAELSVRTVPGQDWAEVMASIEQHLKYEFSRRGSPNTLEVTRKCHIPPWVGDHTSALFKSAEEAITATWKVAPLHVREGGTMPVLHTMQSELKVPVLQLPLGQAKDSPHLPNERMRVENLVKGVNVIKLMLRNLAAVNRPRVDPSRS